MNLRKCKKQLHAKYDVHPYASNTLFVEWFPANYTQREFSRILFISRLYLHVFLLLRTFSPLGFKEVRLMSKESRHSGGDPLVMCFVDFINHVQAGTALGALQGEHKKLTILLHFM
ncbi:hypothetical protein MKX03_002299 [Papaver bracteatum]|nr:hypothetical protein MKX03_002299 [Papaver bracteatum]